MSGIRTDKLAAWRKVERTLRFRADYIKTCKKAWDKRKVERKLQLALNAMCAAQQSGRFDARQIRAVQQLVDATFNLALLDLIE